MNLLSFKSWLCDNHFFLFLDKNGLSSNNSIYEIIDFGLPLWVKFALLPELLKDILIELLIIESIDGITKNFRVDIIFFIEANWPKCSSCSFMVKFVDRFH